MYYLKMTYLLRGPVAQLDGANCSDNNFMGSSQLTFPKERKSGHIHPVDLYGFATICFVK